MTPERWNQIDKVLQSALELKPFERAAFLDKACAGDESLRREVESLIASHKSSFMEKPAFDATEVATSGPGEPGNKADPLVGTSLGRYRFIELLGKGGMGKVYLAHDTNLGRKVAIKVLSSDLTEDETLLRRFKQEAHAVSILNHPNILTIHDIGEIDSLHFISTEYIQGETLDHCLSRSSLTIADALNIAVQVASGLAEAHRAGIVHRDIKPNNIILRPDGNVKVIDFGIAKFVEQRASSGNHDAPRVTVLETKPGMVLGTPHYMSPEQVRGSKLDERSDIFSFGVMLYEMISGALPFHGPTLGDVIAAILKEEPKPLSEYSPSVPRDLSEMVIKALEKPKENRYQKISDLLLDLQGVKRNLETLSASSQARLKVSPPGPLSESPPVSLPVELTSFVGRDTESVALRKLLQHQDTRLVTLTGTGGVGKTRLSVRVAALLANQFSDGVHFMPLASINDPELIAPEVARILGVREAHGQSLSTRLKEHLSGKQMLLVLDNFEQVISGAPLIGELLTSCIGLKVLVTSRVLLRLRGEHEFQVRPLELPDLNRHQSIEDLSTCPAVTLFVERARSVNPRFLVTDENAGAVAEICVRLEGLPLAIELAAARLKILQPGAILSRLGSRLNLLTRGPADLPARQQTMRKTIAWSYDLLPEREKKLFRQLAVFVGGFTLSAVESVCKEASVSELSVLDGISSLLENSLLRQQEGYAPRFVMLETIREFALERLMKTRRAESVRSAHATFFVRLAEEAGRELSGAAQMEWFERLEADRDNLRAALRWSSEGGEVEVGLRIAASPWRFWEVHGPLSEGRRWLKALLAKSAQGEVSTKVRAKSLYAAGLLAHIQNDCREARTFLKQSLVLYREMEDKKGIASSLGALGLLAHDEGDDDRALRLLEEGLALCRELGDKHGTAYALDNLGLVARDQGDYDRALSLHEESVAIRRELGDDLGAAASLNNAGLVALDRGDYKHASTVFDQTLTIFRRMRNGLGTAVSLNNLGEVAELQSNYEDATALFTESLDYLRQEGDKVNTGIVVKNLGNVARRSGDAERAESLYKESLALVKETGERSIIASCLEGLAGVAFGQGQLERAAILFGAAEGVREDAHTPLPLCRSADHESAVGAVRSAMGDAASTAWLSGRGMSLEQAIAHALS
jgi:non-specific serine/threonine protein kinase